MKILHFSDRSDPNRGNYFSYADAMFITGDLSYFDFLPIAEQIAQKPCFGVYGNHCVVGYMEKFGIKNMHLKVENWSGSLIGGFEGCLKYKDSGGPQFTEEEAERLLLNFPAVDLLLLHAAPLGLLDTPGDIVHTGSKAVRDYIDRTKPRFVFCGHDSPSAELQYNGIKIFRTDGARIIEI